jgi:hypothetical protein
MLPTGNYPVNGVFSDPTYAVYSGYIASSLNAGFLEIDNQNRKNLVWYAGKEVGVEIRSGVFTAPAQGVKVVLPEDDSRLHAFPITGNSGTIVHCQYCRKPIPLW